MILCVSAAPLLFWRLNTKKLSHVESATRTSC